MVAREALEDRELTLPDSNLALNSSLRVVRVSFLMLRCCTWDGVFLIKILIKVVGTSLSLLGRMSFLATRESLNVTLIILSSTSSVPPDQRDTPLGNFVGKFGQTICINLLIMETWVLSLLGKNALSRG